MTGSWWCAATSTGFSLRLSLAHLLILQPGELHPVTRRRTVSPAMIPTALSSPSHHSQQGVQHGAAGTSGRATVTGRHSGGGGCGGGSLQLNAQPTEQGC